MPRALRLNKKNYDALKLSVEQRNYLNGQGSEDLHRFYKRDMDVFISLSEWYFDAICELVRLKGFESNVAFVSKRLGISREEAQSSVNRLFEIGLLKETPNKTWIVPNENSIVYGGDQTNFALQRLQRQLLEKAIEALEITPKKDLPEAKTKIKEFHQELCKFLQRPNRDSDEVYQLVTSFFPLTKVEND